MAGSIGEILARIVEVGSLQHRMNAQLIKFCLKVLSAHSPIMALSRSVPPGFEEGAERDSRPRAERDNYRTHWQLLF